MLTATKHTADNNFVLQ